MNRESIYFASESIVPMRAAAAESSEMISQLVFGDLVVILDHQANWAKVRHLDDDYEGWVNLLMLMGLEDIPKEWRHVVDRPCLLKREDGTLMTLPLGARFPGRSEHYFIVGDRRWDCVGVPMLSRDKEPLEIAEVAHLFRNTPYLWGGRSSFGIDCSGFTQIVYRICGLRIARDSSVQQLGGEKIAFSERRSGDLAFFGKLDSEKVSHVGIVDSDLRILHASGRVRLDFLTENGILVDENIENYSHNLISINRYF